MKLEDTLPLEQHYKAIRTLHESLELSDPIHQSLFCYRSYKPLQWNVEFHKYVRYILLSSARSQIIHRPTCILRGRNLVPRAYLLMCIPECPFRQCRKCLVRLLPPVEPSACFAIQANTAHQSQSPDAYPGMVQKHISAIHPAAKFQY